MLIVLTSEKPLQNEASKINCLFDNGLEVLHLRKPNFGAKGYRDLLKSIDQLFYDRIMIHQHHELCREFHLKGIHIQEQTRLDLRNNLNQYIKHFKENDYSISASFHTKEDILSNSRLYDYVLLSPVFNSISKQGYKGKGFDVSDLDQYVIGMGGINVKTAPKAKALGFHGVGVLGGICWDMDDYLERFLAIKNALVAN